jgi:hypothetical protein
MQGIVSIGVSAAKILAEDISQEYCVRRKDETDVVRGRIETYIQSSLCTAFAQVSLYCELVLLDLFLLPSFFFYLTMSVR